MCDVRYLVKKVHPQHFKKIIKKRNQIKKKKTARLLTIVRVTLIQSLVTQLQQSSFL